MGTPVNALAKGPVGESSYFPLQSIFLLSQYMRGHRHLLRHLIGGKLRATDVFTCGEARCLAKSRLSCFSFLLICTWGSFGYALLCRPAQLRRHGLRSAQSQFPRDTVWKKSTRTAKAGVDVDSILARNIEMLKWRRRLKLPFNRHTDGTRQHHSLFQLAGAYSCRGQVEQLQDYG